MLLCLSVVLGMPFSVTTWDLMAAAADGTPAEVAKDPAQRDLAKAAPGDLVQIKVFDEDSISGEFSVDATGEILYPLIGQISVEGFDSRGIAGRLEELLEADYLRDADVSVSITKTAVSNSSVVVFGAVRTPGQVSYPQGDMLQLFQAISECGGFDEKARTEIVEVQRAGATGMTTHRVDVQGKQPFALEDGDIVVVKEKPVAVVVQPKDRPKAYVIVIGQVAHPGRVEIFADEETSLITAVALAGDFTRLARKSKVTITRVDRASGEKQAFTIDAGDIINGKREPVMIQPGDTIYVPETRF